MSSTFVCPARTFRKFIENAPLPMDFVCRKINLFDCPKQFWYRYSDEELLLAVTRPGVMSHEQRRLFLVMVLSSIEDKLTDPRSLNILTKLRTNEPITDEDKHDAFMAREKADADWSTWEAEDKDEASEMADACDAKIDAANAALNAANQNYFCTSSDAANAKIYYAAAKAAQANWVRENFKLCDLTQSNEV